MYHRFVDDRRVICLHVDDMLIMGTYIESVEECKRLISSACKMKDLEKVDVILSIKMVGSKSGTSLIQSHYI